MVKPVDWENYKCMHCAYAPEPSARLKRWWKATQESDPNESMRRCRLYGCIVDKDEPACPDVELAP